MGNGDARGQRRRCKRTGTTREICSCDDQARGAQLCQGRSDLADFFAVGECRHDTNGLHISDLSQSRKGRSGFGLARIESGRVDDGEHAFGNSRL